MRLRLLGVHRRTLDMLDGRVRGLRGSLRAVDSSHALHGVLVSGLFSRDARQRRRRRQDVPVLRRACGLDWGHYKQIEDTMQAHAVLWSELPHDLEFLASLYGRYHKMKHLRHTDPLRYHKGDVLEAMSVWEALKGELWDEGVAGLSHGWTDSRPSSLSVYRQQLRLLPHIDRSMSVGIAVDGAAVERA